jgi:hypothetical protein
MTFMDFNYLKHAFAPVPAPRYRANKRRLHLAWKSIVKNHTNRQLTLHSDKFNAIRGVTNVLGEIMQDSNIAGLWREHLWLDLLWVVDLRRSLPPPRPPNWTAPSWSWLSVAAPVTYEWPYDTIKFKGRITSMVEVVNVTRDEECAPRNDWEGWSIRIKGRMVPVRTNIMSAEHREIERTFWYHLRTEDQEANTKAPVNGSSSSAGVRELDARRQHLREQR